MILEYSRRSDNRIGPLIMVAMGVFQFYVFWFLYYSVELPILACISALVGTFLQVIGMIRLYQRAKTSQGATLIISLIISLVLLWSWWIVYYFFLIQQHIFN
ncbi:MAG: hypothetical protein JW776_04155 [Candidatus Lokiarchaeota archaeon]|nr:hypothetical protein [Candidatus Lokiarchaeota archaeon]